MFESKHQSKGLLILFIIEFAMRFSYWGTMSIVVLYLSKHSHYTNSEAYAVFGSFASFSFIGAIAGGWLADKISGFRYLMLSSIWLLILGNVALIFFPQSILLGLSLIGSGTGLFSPTSANILGEFYGNRQDKRDSGFTIFYVATNIGGLLGPICYGFLMSQAMLKYAFVLSIVIILGWFLLYLSAHKAFENKGNFPKVKFSASTQKFYSLLAMTVITSIIYILMLHHEMMNAFLILIAVITIGLLSKTFLSLNKQARTNTLSLLFMIAVVLYFFACELQTNGSFIIFIQQFVDRDILGWRIPSAMFAALEPGFVILLPALVIYFWKVIGKEPSTLYKQVIGLFILSMSFLIFAILAWFIGTQKQLGPMWLVLLAMMFLGLAEILVMPPLMAAITKLAPEKLKGTLMGLLYLSLAYSGYLAGIIAKFTTHPIQVNNVFSYYSIYKNIVILTFSLAVSILVIKKMTQD